VFLVTPSTTIDVAHPLNRGRWAPHEQCLVFLTALTIIFDGIENQLPGVAIPSIMHDWPRGARRVCAGFAAEPRGMMVVAINARHWRRHCRHLGRLGAILSGYAGAWALEYAASASFFAVMAGAVVITLASLATVRRHAAGKES
jgi:hypothetical protein